MIENGQKIVLLASLLVSICAVSLVAILGVIKSCSPNDAPAICFAILTTLALSAISFFVSILRYD